tara:strand:- start:1190 stop:1660 length:471 start_codon:yes stop_codon:yes gene_type:complete
MKITNEQLRRIIKEELENVVQEEKNSKITSDDIQAGKELQNTPIGNVIFKSLDKNPKVQKALKLVKQKMNEEEEPNVAGQYAMIGGTGGTAAAATSISSAFWTGAATKSLTPAILGALKAIGIGTGAFAGGALAGYLIYKLGEKAIEAMSEKGEQQ